MASSSTNRSTGAGGEGPTSASTSTPYSKYANLPDVDVSAPDVYESAAGLSKSSHAKASDPSRRSSDSRRRRIQRSEGDSFDESGDEDSSDFSSDEDSGKRDGRGAGKHKGTTNSAPNEDIDSTSLRKTDAAAKFSKATDLNADEVDHSGTLKKSRVGRRNRKAISSSRPKDAGLETDVYVLGSGHSPTSAETRNESKLDRLRRLKYEASLLEEELAQEGKAGDGLYKVSDTNASEQLASANMPSSQDVLSQLKVLQDQLSRLDTLVPPTSSESASDDRIPGEHDFQNLLTQLVHPARASTSTPDDGGVLATDAAGKGATNASSSTEIVQLDQRLAELESALGLKEALLDETKPLPVRPIVRTLTRLESQLSILSQPRHLDAVSRRVKVLNSEMEKVVESRRKLTSMEVGHQDSSSGNPASTSTSLLTSTDIAKLQTTFDITSRLEPLLPLIPLVLGRLQSLSELHSSAAHFKDTLDDLERSTEIRQEQQQQLKELLAKMKVNMKENQEKVQANVQSLQARIETVAQSLQEVKK